MVISIKSHTDDTHSSVTKLMGDLAAVAERQDEQTNRIKLRISTYERMYDMLSDEMMSRVDSGQLPETDEICLWRMDIALLRHVTSA
jgi:hypothetical protein